MSRKTLHNHALSDVLILKGWILRKNVGKFRDLFFSCAPCARWYVLCRALGPPQECC